MHSPVVAVGTPVSFGQNPSGSFGGTDGAIPAVVNVGNMTMTLNKHHANKARVRAFTNNLKQLIDLIVLIQWSMVVGRLHT
mmetsp:Transcript_8465/g.12704  ORF Transcript_8465/g.12704 Transcript_8465/m.12704 type:complete len:81 (+) Transcript_8465:428-670(+)